MAAAGDDVLLGRLAIGYDGDVRVRTYEADASSVDLEPFGGKKIKRAWII
jgi:hypothetical protein